MTVSSTQSYIEYNADGSTVTFSIPFYFLQNSDISASLADPAGNVTDLVYGTNFSVSGSGDESGGTATTNVAYASGYKLLFYRNPPVTQETKYYENGKFPAVSHEAALDKLTMLIQEIRWWFDTRVLKKPSYLSNYYDASNQKISNLADAGGDQDAVNLRGMRSYVERLVAGVVGGYGSFTQAGAGAVARTFQDKMREQVSLKDFNAAGDGVTDDTAALNAAIASLGTSGGTVLIPKNSDGTERRYLISDWTKVVNPFGVKFTGEGALVSPESVGGYTQHNLYGNQFKVSYGLEYLYRICKRFELQQQAQVFLFGDSTVQGGNGEDSAYSTGTLVFDMFQAAGLNVNITNRGVAGTSWYQMNAVPDISATSDLFIIKYGINDGGTPGSGDRLANLATAIRSKLAEIRSSTYGGVNTLSIIIVGPNSTNDTQHNRDAIWYEKQRGILLQAARDYQCAYFDTYGMMPDVKNAAGYAMDNPFSNGQGVHPMNTMQCWIWGNVIETFFSHVAVEKYRNNGFVNAPSTSGTPNVATVLTNYRKGISAYRATVAAGWQYEGAVHTYRSADDVGLQKLISFDKSGSKVIQRTWNTTTGAWNNWTGTAVGLTPTNSWTATTTPEARISAEGLVTISAKLTGGATATGTQVLSGLPAYMRPPVEKRFAICNDNGTQTSIGVNANTGNVFLVGTATDATAGFHINISYYVN